MPITDESILPKGNISEERIAKPATCGRFAFSNQRKEVTTDSCGETLRVRLNHSKRIIMKKKLFTLFVVLTILALSTVAAQAKPNADKSICTKIQDGTLTDSNGNVLVLGYDQFGYNYQAHLFNGTYDSVDRVLDGMYWGNTGDYVDDKLTMKWSEDWLSNQDCTGDGKLDRGTDGTSLGWETNHIIGDYDSDGNGTQDAHFTYFAKIVWVGPGGSLWGQYDTIEEIYNDPVGGAHGLQVKVDAPGFGLNDQWTEQ
jgi:hypothetical protein